MVVAEEVVRQGYANAGRVDAHRPERCLFITAEQFAFAAGVSGIILRDRPATNIYFGTFYGESLLLAETGFLTGAVQIAGTAELTQLPFFVAGDRPDAQVDLYVPAREAWNGRLALVVARSEAQKCVRCCSLLNPC